MKSPSDITIYVPALQRKVANHPEIKSTTAIIGNNKVVSKDYVGTTSEASNQLDADRRLKDNKLMLRISNFVDQLRLEHEHKDGGSANTDVELQQDEKNQSRLKSTVHAVNAPLGLNEAQRQMEQAIVETEKFKATVKKPLGKETFDLLTGEVSNRQMGKISELEASSSGVSSDLSNQDSRQVIHAGLSDDDFFHITCHIHLGLRKKIENGEYIDLD